MENYPSSKFSQEFSEESVVHKIKNWRYFIKGPTGIDTESAELMDKIAELLISEVPATEIQQAMDVAMDFQRQSRTERGYNARLHSLLRDARIAPIQAMIELATNRGLITPEEEEDELERKIESRI